jgi:hypothetical protein
LEGRQPALVIVEAKVTRLLHDAELLHRHLLRVLFAVGTDVNSLDQLERPRQHWHGFRRPSAAAHRGPFFVEHEPRIFEQDLARLAPLRLGEAGRGVPDIGRCRDLAGDALSAVVVLAPHDAHDERQHDRIQAAEHAEDDATDVVVRTELEAAEPPPDDEVRTDRDGRRPGHAGEEQQECRDLVKRHLRHAFAVQPPTASGRLLEQARLA